MIEINIRKDRTYCSNPKKWQFSVGSCHAAMALRTDYCRQLKQVHEELGIRYVRFHGIFNDDMKTLSTFEDILSIPGADHLVERSFHRCGIAFDNVLSCGMKPFVELSFMPELLAADTSHGKGFYGSIMSMPKSLSLWKEHITKFIEFLLHRYGFEEISQWYFEVWNEPDLQGMFFKGTKEDYFSLYQITADAIKNISPQLKVGGPATSGSRWIKDFTEFCRSANVPLDFVSTHQYMGEPFIGYDGNQTEEAENFEKVKEQMDQASAMFAQIPAGTPLLTVLRGMFGDPTETKEMDMDILPKNSKVVKEIANELPVFYTEWNMSATFSAYSNDTRKAASYDVINALKTDHIVDGSSIWCFSDLFEELHQFTEEFHGGFGMMTLNGIKKPVYHGMQMLSETGNRRIEMQEKTEDIEHFAFETEDKLQILLTRPYVKQEELHSKEITVQIESVQTPVRVMERRIDEHTGNPLKNWEEMGSPKDMNKKELESLAEMSELKDVGIQFEVKNGKIVFSTQLGVNDLSFIQIIY
ncbi:MAG: GH39 family glycosyl hydrolase [Dysgonomonas sp.]